VPQFHKKTMGALHILSPSVHSPTRADSVHSEFGALQIIYLLAYLHRQHITAIITMTDYKQCKKSLRIKCLRCRLRKGCSRGRGLMGAMPLTQTTTVENFKRINIYGCIANVGAMTRPSKVPAIVASCSPSLVR